MKFSLQNTNDSDFAIIKEVLDRAPMIKYSLDTSGGKDTIPIGTIEYVEKWLKENYGILQINPIEVPPVLRTEEFLKRNYLFVNGERILAEGKSLTSSMFIKDVSRLKASIAFPNTKLDIDPTHIYQLSGYLNILSEYRVYIINSKIVAISHYDGDPLVFPDVALINKANLLWSLQEDYPKSCTIDVAVTKDGTAVIECHPFISCGLYTSLWGTNLLNAYRDGIEYVLKYNTPLLKSLKI